jgi:phage gp36-like protein
MSQYATAVQFYSLGLRQDAVPSGADVNLALQACSGMVDSAAAASGRFNPPFTTWTEAMTLNVCKLAAYEILSTEGFNPDTNRQDRNVLTRWQQAMSWLKELKAGEAFLSGAVDTPAEGSALPALSAEAFSDDLQGWESA